MISRTIGSLILLASLACVYFFDLAGSIDGPWRILHWPAIALTGLGPVGLVLMCTDWRDVKNAARLLVRFSPVKQRLKYQKEADALASLAQKYYALGCRSLEGVAGVSFSRHARKTIERISVKMPIADVRMLLERERDKTDVRLRAATALTSIGVKLSPSVGMLGTILGMVQLLSHLKDPSNIGAHMGLALLTTFYGLFTSMVVWAPLNQRLEALRETELHAYDQTSHWLSLLEQRKPTHYLAEDHENTIGH